MKREGPEGEGRREERERYAHHSCDRDGSFVGRSREGRADPSVEANKSGVGLSHEEEGDVWRKERVASVNKFS